MIREDKRPFAELPGGQHFFANGETRTPDPDGQRIKLVAPISPGANAVGYDGKFYRVDPDEMVLVFSLNGRSRSSGSERAWAWIAIGSFFFAIVATAILTHGIPLKDLLAGF